MTNNEKDFIIIMMTIRLCLIEFDNIGLLKAISKFNEHPYTAIELHQYSKNEPSHIQEIIQSHPNWKSTASLILDNINSLD